MMAPRFFHCRISIFESRFSNPDSAFVQFPWLWTKQPRGRGPVGNAEVFVREPGRYAAARRALQKADLQQIRFVDIFDRIDLFTKHGGNGIDADRTSVESLDDGAQQFPVDLVETLVVHIQ